MLASIALNGIVLHETSTRAVASVSGLIGISPVRRNVRTCPSASGSIDESLFRDEQLVVIGGNTSGLAGSVDQAISEFRAISAALLSTLAAPGTLTWTEGVSGLALQRSVKLASACEPELSEAAALIDYQAVLASADPNAYSQTLQVVVGAPLSASSGGAVFPLDFPVTFAPGGSGTAMFTNAGNADTRPLLQIFGEVVNPSVGIPGGRRISLSGTIAAGDYVEIDLANRTLTRVSGTVRSSARGMLDSSSSQWFALPAGISTVQMLASSYGVTAHLEIVGRSAYA